MPINTRHIPGRRTLHFATLDEALADADALTRTPHRRLGNYTLGQNTAHLAQVIEYTLDGFPPLRIPRVLRLVGPLMARRLLRKGFPAGVRAPGDAAAAFTPPDASAEEGLDRFRTAIERLKREPQRHPSPLFGELSPEQWDRFHCRHAELHLSFLVPAEP